MIPHHYQWVTDEKCLQSQKVSWTRPYRQTLMHVRQQLVPPSLSTASIPYLTHSVWRASSWPVNMCARVCVHVWPQWRLIRAGYGKRRLKPWIMEKLIWSMDQQETVSMQHTHTHAQTLFTKWRPCRNSTVIGNNYDPQAATFQWQRLSRVSGPWSSRAKSFYCSKINIQLVKIWAPRWETWA